MKRTTARLNTLLLLPALVLAFACTAAADNDKPEPRGIIAGRVTDAETLRPVVGATVQIDAQPLGAACDTTGAFVIRKVPVGAYSLRITCVGYAGVVVTDVIVKSSRTTEITALLSPVAPEVGQISVTPRFFPSGEKEPTSRHAFSGEEIRRSPGSGGDVARIIAALPSVAKVDDQVNSLAVRGGNPFENGFYIDNIAIPNISHFPRQGTTGGGLGMLNVDLLRDVTFSAGAFSAAHGDRLSAIMELSLREGSRDGFDGQLSFDMIGLGAVAEGPIPGKRGSYLVSVRRSYMDWLVDIADIEVAPVMGDYQGKVVFDLSNKHQISVVGILSSDYIDYNKEQATKDGNTNYGISDNTIYAAGLNWRYLWGTQGYSRTSLSLTGAGYGGDYFETSTDSRLVRNDSHEHSARLRNVNVRQLGSALETEFGAEGEYVFDKMDYEISEYTNPVGDTLPGLVVHDDFEALKAGAFFSLTARPTARLALTIGSRLDYFDYTEHVYVSPRLSASYTLNDRTSLYAGTGVYYQTNTSLVLSRDPEYRDLKTPRAYHAVLGFERLLREDTRLTVESYFKAYEDFPMDPDQPAFFILDGVNSELVVNNYGRLVSEGQARSYGVELTVQKKLASGVYGLAGAAVSRTEYKGLDGLWRKRIFDNGLSFTAEGGYKPNRSWEFSIRWVAAGGRPYTPLDLDASENINRTVLDDSRVNADRYPFYHSLNVRADRRFHFGGSNLIVYLSLWNAYNHENVSTYYWNELERRQDVVNQWGLLPILGIEYEF